jgi:hypothetical protein
MRLWMLAVVWAALVMPAQAQTVSYGEAMDQLVASCGADVDAYCKDVRLGGSRIQDCLAANSSKVSPTRKATFGCVSDLLSIRAKAQAAAPELCKSEASRLCENFREGRGRLLRCLIRPENARNVSKKCNQAITDAGWR